MSKAMSKQPPIQLSILDLATIYNNDTASQTLQHSTNIVQLADRLGYTRYWFAEHHNTRFQVSSSPDLLATHAAAHTQRIRVGSGGIMLPNHSPLKVVENFSLLESLHPGRIDLGIGRAPGTDGITALALRRSREAVTTYDFPEQFAELLAFFTNDFPDEHPFSKISATAEESIPNLFMLGSSDGGMQFAAEYGLGFAFAAHINPRLAIPMLQTYRERFKPSPFLSEPKGILALIVVCAETEERAHQLALPAQLQWARWGTGNYKLPPPSLEEAISHSFSPAEESVTKENEGRFVIGTPSQVKKQLESLAEQAMVDEIMILNMIPDIQAREQSFYLLAEAFQLA
ncbi:LLM class flavin-dependent oxidoreductase [Sporosarcina ureae]|uniref:LLM class flavin-dependent oxidoreductase n=1 Tax=Sporosarcina ureae TaxID=1571 RepID=UPI001F2FAD51|nr:LLM class flavin-dependent oxidoreductase [Sporosarcina ureae]